MDKSSKTIQHDLRRGKATLPEPLEIWVKRLGYALRCINDLSMLNQSPLARLAYVERLAKDKYQGRILPKGMALRQLLLACIAHVMKDVGEEPSLSKACQYLQLRAVGLSCQEISTEMGLSREHVSRHYRRKALELVVEAFLFQVEDGE